MCNTSEKLLGIPANRMGRAAAVSFLKALANLNCTLAPFICMSRDRGVFDVPHPPKVQSPRWYKEILRLVS